MYLSVALLVSKQIRNWLESWTRISSYLHGKSQQGLTVISLPGRWYCPVSSQNGAWNLPQWLLIPVTTTTCTQGQGPGLYKNRSFKRSVVPYVARVSNDMSKLLNNGARETAQQLRVNITLSEDLNLIPSLNLRQFTIPCNSKSSWFDAL